MNLLKSLDLGALVLKSPRSRFAVLTVLALLVDAAVLSPLLSTGYSNDDALNSFLPGYLEYTNTNVWNFTWSNFWVWVTTQGRFFPLAFYTYPLYTYVTSLWLYKLGAMIFTLGAFWLCSVFVGRAFQNKAMGLAMLLLPSVFVQFRGSLDPVLSFQYLLPLSLIYLSGSMYLFLVWLDSGRRVALLLSAAVFLVALLTYEINIAYVVVYPILSRFRRGGWRRVFLDILPILIVSALVLALSLYLRSRNIPIDPRYTISFSLVDYLRALGGHIYASFPLSSYFSGLRLSVLRETAKDVLTNTPWWLGFVGVVGSMAFGGALYRTHRSQIKRIGLLGIVFLILPFVLIALSVTHQSYSLGTGYLPIFLGYAGAMLFLLAVALAWLGRVRTELARRWLSVVFAGAFFCVLLVNYQANQNVVQGQNRYWLYPRTMLEQALNRGLLTGVPEESTIVFDSTFPWDNEFLVMMHAKVRVKVLHSGSKPQDSEALRKQIDVGKVYFLKYGSDGLDRGYAFLGQVLSIDPKYWESHSSDTGLVSVAATHAFYYEGKSLVEAWAVDQRPLMDASRWLQALVFGNTMPSAAVLSGDAESLFEDGSEASPVETLAAHRWVMASGLPVVGATQERQDSGTTVECLIPPTAGVESPSVRFDSRLVSPRLPSIVIQASEGGLTSRYELRLRTTGFQDSAFSMSLGPKGWHYLVITFTAAESSVWLDGILLGRATNVAVKDPAPNSRLSVQVAHELPIDKLVALVRWRPGVVEDSQIREMSSSISNLSR